MVPRKVSLSDAVARDLPLPERGDVVYWDTKTAYFGLRVQSGGTKQWILQKKVNRRAVKVTLGVFHRPGDDKVRRMTYTEAKKAAIEPLAALAAGRDPNLEKRQQARAQEQARADEQHTVLRCLELYITNCREGTKPRKANTLKGYERTKARVADSALGRVPLLELTEQHLLDYYAEQCRRAKKTATAKRGGKTQAGGDLRTLRAAHRYAVDKLRLTINANPFTALNKELPGWFKTRARQITVATAEGQLAAWWTAVAAIRAGVETAVGVYDKKRKAASAAIADFLFLAVLWGLRRTELLELRWDYFNFQYGYLHAPGEPSEWSQGTKNHKDIVKPLTRYVRELLERRRQENELYAPGSDWVFPSLRKNAKGQQWHIAEPKGVIERVRKASGLDFSPQDLRRTFGTLFSELETGADIVRVALSHSADDTASKHYLQSRLETYRGICQRYEDKVLLEARVTPVVAPEATIPADEYAAFLAWKAATEAV